MSSNPRHPLTDDLYLLEPLDPAALVTDWAVLLGFDSYDAWCAHVAAFTAAVAEIDGREKETK